MGRKSRADLISELKTAGAKGSLSKMNRTKLMEMHAQMIPQGGSAGQLPSVAPISGSVKTEVATETGTGQRPSTEPIRTLRIDPDEDDISDYLEGGGWWKSLAGDVTNAAKATVSGVEKGASAVGKEATKVGKAVATGAKEFQKSDIGKDIELAGVDVGEAGTIALGDTALMASSVVDGPAGAAASAGLDVAASEGADALREKIRDS